MITHHDIHSSPWHETLVTHGMAPYLIEHLSATTDLHGADRYVRTTDDVLNATETAANLA